MDKDEAIQQFMELTAADNEVATFYLELSKWDIQRAIASYYGSDGDEHEEQEPVDVDIETEINEPMQIKGGLNNLNVAANQSTKSSKSRDKIATLSSLKHNNSDDENEEKGQAFYVGGSERGGGQQVLGPPRVGKKQNPSNVQDLFKSAQSHGAEVVADSPPDAGPPGSRAFSGSGYRLGDEHTPSILTNRACSSDFNPANPQRVLVTVKIWSNGFTINDGQLRSLTEPNDLAFLRSLSSGQIPSELLQQHKYEKIDLNMEDHSSEEYKAPPKPKVVPFHGTGQMLGSPVPKVISNVNTTIRPQETVSPIILDETQPVTQLQVRLSDNSRLVVRMNYNHTVGDIRKQIISQCPQYNGVSFNLMTTFPNKVLTDDLVTLQDANLLNAVIVQRLM